MFGYIIIWRSVSTAGGTHCSRESTSKLPLATDNYLSGYSNPSEEGQVVVKARHLRLNHSAPSIKKKKRKIGGEVGAFCLLILNKHVQSPAGVISKVMQ